MSSVVPQYFARRGTQAFVNAVGKRQGIGFLDDGSMVVITDAAEQIGKPIRCTVLRLHTTANGRMVFAERVREGSVVPLPAADGRPGPSRAGGP